MKRIDRHILHVRGCAVKLWRWDGQAREDMSSVSRVTCQHFPTKKLITAKNGGGVRKKVLGEDVRAMYVYIYIYMYVSDPYSGRVGTMSARARFWEDVGPLYRSITYIQWYTGREQGGRI